MKERIRAVVAVLAWLGFLVGAIVTLHALGNGGLAAPTVGRLSEWLAARDAAIAAFAVLRLVALVTAWYLFGATVVALGLRLVKAPQAAAVAVESTTPVFVRRLIRGATGLVLAVTVSGSVGTAMAESRPVDEAPVMMRRLPDVGNDTPHVPADPVTMRLLPAPDDAVVAPATWTVEPGQHLWSVAETVLIRAWTRPPTDREIDPYWRHLVERNRTRLADPQSPDLLFPGQILDVPLPPAEPPPGEA